MFFLPALAAEAALFIAKVAAGPSSSESVKVYRSGHSYNFCLLTTTKDILEPIEATLLTAPMVSL